MKFGVSFRADRRIQDQIDSLDFIASLLADFYVEKSTRFTSGDFDFLYFVTDKVGAGTAQMWALLTDFPAIFVGPI